MSLRLNLYDKDVGELGNEFHGDITLSVAGAFDGKFFDMGWCFRPVYAAHESSSLNYNCLNVRFYYKESEHDDPTAPGYTETFIG